MNTLTIIAMIFLDFLLLIAAIGAVFAAFVIGKDAYLEYKDKRKARTTGWKEENIEFHEPIGYENYIIKKEEPT